MNIIQRLIRRAAGADAGNAAWLQSAAARVGQQLAGHQAGALRQAARSFKAAETPAWMGSWATTGSDINDDLAKQLPTMRARAKGQARSDEWAGSYLIRLDDNVLGEHGIQLQCKVKLADGTTPDKAANDALERFWRRWGKRGACDVSGKLTWREIESILLGCEERCGEILWRWRGGGPFGVRIQPLAPELLDASLKRDWQGRRVRMGVEIDDDGAPVAYWLRAAKAGEGGSDSTDITTVGKHIRVPADQIVHRFETKEVDQLRGIPGLSVGAARLWQLHDFEEAAAVAASNAAKREGFFFSPDGEAPPGMADTIVSSVLAAAQAEGKTLSADELQALQAAAQKYATTMPGQFDTLPVGYDFKPFDSKWPDISADGHIKGHVRAWTAARGVSYHTIGNDLSDVNYSSAQVGIVAERDHYRRRQRRLISWLHDEVAQRVLARAPLYETGLRPSRRDEYLAAIDWLPRTWAPVDPLKAAEADDIRLRNRSTSRRRIWLSQGLDPDEMQAEIQAEEAVFGRLDAPPNAGTSATSARHDAADGVTAPRSRLAVVNGSPARTD